MAAPPKASLSSFSPIARCTTGGPDGKICDCPLTMTVKCDISANAAGAPATEPMIPAATGTLVSNSTPFHHSSPEGRPMWPAASSDLELWPTPSTNWMYGMPYWIASGCVNWRWCLCTLCGLPPEMVKSSPPIATERPSISARPIT